MLVHQEVDETIADTLEFPDKWMRRTYEALYGKEDVVASETLGERVKRRMRCSRRSSKTVLTALVGIKWTLAS